MESCSVDASETRCINRGSSVLDYASSQTALTEGQIEATPRRHVILVLFVLAAALNGLPFSHNFIGKAFVIYYDTTDSVVNLLAMVYMASFLLSFYPANWFFETRGLRSGVLIGLFFSTIGGWIYCASMRPNLFWVAVTAQTIAGLGQPFMLNVPPYLATIWFPADEVSRACALASFGAPVGILVGVAALPFVMTGQDTDTLYTQFLWYHIVYACLVSLLLILAFIVFKDQPTYPPSLARAEQLLNPTNASVAKSLVTLLKNKNFLIQIVAFGFMNGTQNAFVSIVNQIVLEIYPSLNNSLWVIGLLLCVAGISSCLLIGLIMDKTHKYKECAFVSIFLTALAVGAWSGFMHSGVTALYVTTFFLGFFCVGYIPAGLELGAEITYPVSQVTATSLLTVSGCIAGIALTFLGTWSLENYGNLAACLTFLAFVLVALLVTGFIKSDLRRLEANTQRTPDVEEEAR